MQSFEEALSENKHLHIQLKHAEDEINSLRLELRRTSEVSTCTLAE